MLKHIEKSEQRTSGMFRLRSYLVALREALKFWDKFPGHRSNKRTRIVSEIKRVERILNGNK